MRKWIWLGIEEGQGNGIEYIMSTHGHYYFLKSITLRLALQNIPKGAVCQTKIHKPSNLRTFLRFDIRCSNRLKILQSWRPRREKRLRSVTIWQKWNYSRILHCLQIQRRYRIGSVQNFRNSLWLQFHFSNTPSIPISTPRGKIKAYQNTPAVESYLSKIKCKTIKR